MIKLSQFAVENNRAMIFMALLLSLIVGYLIFHIPQGVFPDATFPRIAVLVDYGLASITEMEMEVTKPIEEAAMMVEGVRTVRTSITRGSAEINIDFQWDQDMFRAYQLVQAQVSGIQNMTDFIKSAIRSVRDTIFLGAFLTFLILLLFLRRLRITLVVFIPLVFLTGVPGIFFRALASTLAIVVVVSMILAVFLTPALAVVFISTKKKMPG